MNELLKDEIMILIDELTISDELKKELHYFHNKMTEIISKDYHVIFDIIIDERGQKEINILLEYVTNIIEKYDLFHSFVSFNRNIDINDINNSVIIIDDFNLFYDEIIDRYNGEKKLATWIETVRSNDNMIIFTSHNKFDDNIENINKKIINPDICIHLKGNSKKQMYEELIRRFRNNKIAYRISYEAFLKIINYFENINQVDGNLINYLYDYSIKKLLLNDRKTVTIKTFSEFISNEVKEEKIANLVGLDYIKQELAELYNYLEFSKEAKLDDHLYLNLFFLGNPGTGKTTVARMYARKLFEMGYIKENKVIEIIPTDLLGEYVGQTRRTTRKLLYKASGGILFIDEAYLLCSKNYKGGNNPYMEEAIVELIKYLEDKNNVVIFAGYPNEMKKIYDTNPGIKSRIYKEITFKDYSNQELYEILNNDIKKKKRKLDNKSKNKIIKYIDELKKNANFGNARSMLQLSQKMLINGINRDKCSLFITAADLPALVTNENNIKMGFEMYD